MSGRVNAPASLGLFGATALGVGAIVGGGILALAGVAFATAGPAAILAFVLNGGIAALAVASFASLARRFPESGGTYTYARKVLSIEVAFIVGWVVWFASIVAAVLYALGFAAFAHEGMLRLSGTTAGQTGWLASPVLRPALTVLAVGGYTALLLRRSAGGGNGVSVAKVVVFVVLIGGGVLALVQMGGGEIGARFDPLMPFGPLGVVQAMGYTFIALQGFDLIAAVAGEVREPRKTIPRAMYLSLGIALVIYVPLLYLMTTVGAPAEGIASAAAANPEGLVAEAAGRFMGETGYWLVIGAGVLSMLSALHANLLGASRVAFAMARDRTLPRYVGRMNAAAGVPVVAVGATAAMVLVLALLIGDVAAAGAASSLIFLVSFAMVHWASMLADRRSGSERRRPVPLIGALLCLGLATFQAFAVPAAGGVVAVWLMLGGALYLTLLAPGARTVDARAEAGDPDLARLRGRSPLVLVPVANPAHAASLVDTAATFRTPGVGRVLMLSVVRPLADSDDAPGDPDVDIDSAQRVLSESLRVSLDRSVETETLFSISTDVWTEIARVARGHRCETVLLGLPDLTQPKVEGRLERLLTGLEADVVVLRAPNRWSMSGSRRVLVPLGGRRGHSELRARLLASLSRGGDFEPTFYGTSPADAPIERRMAMERTLHALARNEAVGAFDVQVEEVTDPREAIVRRARESDLVIMGLTRGRRARVFGPIVRAVASETDVPLILIGARPRQGFDVITRSRVRRPGAWPRD